MLLLHKIVKYNYRETFELNETQITNIVNSINNLNKENQIKLDENKERFRLNDRLWILLDKNNVLTYLTLPDQINSMICMDRASVGYLSEKKTSCRLRKVDFDCSKNSKAKKFYDIKSYLGFKFLPVNNFFVNFFIFSKKI